MKADVGGTVTGELLRAGENPQDADAAVYDTAVWDAVVLVADTELILDVDEHFGEAELKITLTPGDDGEITYADFCAQD